MIDQNSKSTKFRCKCKGEISPQYGLCNRCGKLYPQFESIKYYREKMEKLDDWLEQGSQQLGISKLKYIELCKIVGGLEPEMIDLLISIVMFPDVWKT